MKALSSPFKSSKITQQGLYFLVQPYSFQYGASRPKSENSLIYLLNCWVSSRKKKVLSIILKYFVKNPILAQCFLLKGILNEEKAFVRGRKLI